MATITATATYADNLQVDLRDTLASAWIYQATIDGTPNPESKAQFIQRKLNENFVSYIKRTYKAEKLNQANKTDLTIL